MKVLLTGSTGYIGRRLKKKLLEDKNIDLRLLVRNKNGLSSDVANNVEIIQGDTFDTESLKIALKSIDIPTAIKKRLIKIPLKGSRLDSI